VFKTHGFFQGGAPPSVGAVTLAANYEDGTVLAPSYTYSGTRPESGTTYKWYRDGVEVVGSVGSTYTAATRAIGAADYGKNITCQVTPSDGILTGTPVLSSASAPTTNPLWANTLSLLRFEGANGSTTFTDEVSGPTWTRQAPAEISTDQAKWGTTSGKFVTDPGDIVCNNAGSIQSGAFSISAWVYATSGHSALSRILSWGTNEEYVLDLTNATPRILSYYQGGTRDFSKNVSTGQWYFVTLVRAGGFGTAVYLGLDGDVSSVASEAGDWAGNHYRIGNASGSGRTLKGYVGEFRLLNTAVAAWQANFTPPAAPLPRAWL
jgi:hypothetical protein